MQLFKINEILPQKENIYSLNTHKCIVELI